MKKALIILGPTTTGKTDLALELAKKINGELISCDSRQVYIGLDIGTGKEPSKKSEVRIQREEGYWEINGIRVWMYDVADPKKQYDVAAYLKGVKEVIGEIRERRNLPIIVGGTGFYLKALLEDIESLNVPAAPGLRGELNSLTVGQLQSRVVALSPTAFEKMNQSDKNNPRRLIRQIELLSMYPYINKDDPQSSSSALAGYQLLKIGLTAPRSVLNSRIDQRLLSRLDQGMVSEAKTLIERGVSLERLKDFGLEYKYLAMLIGRQLSYEEFVLQLKTKIHQYAKRQMTWFKREKDINWFDITGKNYRIKVEKMVLDWYNEAHGTQS